MNERKVNITQNAIIWIALLLFLVVFFLEAHPLVPYDADDWTYLGYIRHALPMPGTWNPCKVFPETIEGICGYIAGYIFFPLTRNFMGAITAVLSLTYAVWIFMYFYSVSKLFEKKTIITVFIFVAMHFLVFKSQSNNNKYMFGADNVNAVFNYTIPAMLNCITIILLEKDKVRHKGLIWLLIYLSIFSNLYNNVILATYAGVNVLFYLVQTKSIKDVLNKQRVNLIILLLWVCSLFGEKTGQRASQIGKEKLLIVDCWKNIFTMISITGFFFRVIVIVTFVLLLFGIWKNIFDKKVLAKIVLAIGISFIYTMLLCGITNPNYVLRPEVLFATAFYGFLLICYIVNSFLNSVNIDGLYGICVFILCIEVIISRTPYRSINVRCLPEETAYKVGEDIVQQIMTADNNNENVVELHVPLGDTDDNWPHSLYIGGRLSNTLYSLNQASRRMEIRVLPDNKLNEKYNIIYSTN